MLYALLYTVKQLKLTAQWSAWHVAEFCESLLIERGELKQGKYLHYKGQELPPCDV